MFPICLLLATLLSAGASPAIAQTHPGYVWHDLGDGIYVHSQDDPFAGPVDGNSVVLVNDEDVFVVDTHINPAVARAVIDRIRTITDKPVSHVINTHWHDDHTNGNHAYRQAFPDARFVAHGATAEALKKEWGPMEDQRRATYESIAPHDLPAIAASLEAEDPDRATELRLLAAYRDALEPELPGLELVYPDMVADERLEFRRGDRTIVVQWMGHANTHGDLLVWLPRESVLITGDVLVAPVPYAFGSPMVEWVETLRRARALGAGTIIPGHGDVQHDTAYLDAVIDLLESTIGAVRDARLAGVAYEDLATSVDLGAVAAGFEGSSQQQGYAWRSYYLAPGLAAAWASLGYPVPEDRP